MTLRLLAFMVIGVAAVVASPTGMAVESKHACKDGVDNDGDGRTDLADPGCIDKRDTDE